MKKKFIILTLILIIAFVARLYKFNRPVADWHSWRQVDTSSVSRSFVKYGFDLFHPKFDDLSIGVSLLDNPKGYRFVEFPFYNVAQAGLYKIFGHFTLEEWGRLVTIFSQEIAIIFIFLLVELFSGATAGLIAASFFALIPFNVYYGRTILPDSSMVASLMGSVYFFALWIDKEKQKFFILSLILMAVAFLLKPYALFFTLPIAVMAIQKYGLKTVVNKRLWMFALIALLPFAGWRLWMKQFPQGIPQSNWLFNGTTIRFKGAFFQWLFADRISRLILGYFGLPFVVLGIMLKQKKEKLLYLAFLVSSITYLCVMATGNVQHDYYQILIIPTLAIFFGKGVEYMLSHTKDVFSKWVMYPTFCVGILFMFAFSWFLVRDYYNLDHVEVYETGVIADHLIPKDAKVVAPYGGDTTFLYYVNRRGWPVVDRPFKDLIKAGASYMVFAKPTVDEMHLSTLYPIFAKGVTDGGSDYVIFKLQPLTPGKY